MKIEKLYENLNDYISTLEASDAETIKKLAADPTAPVLGDSFGILASILRDVRAEIATAKAKSTGRRGILAAARRLLKVAGDRVGGKFSGAWTGKDGRQYICSGFHGAALNEPLDLPESEGAESLEPVILGSGRGKTQPLTLPTIAQVRAHIKLCTAEKEFLDWKKGQIVWDFGPGRPLVNARYLLDVLELLPDASACHIADQPESGPIYFTGPSGDGILLPVRLHENYTRENTALRYAPPEDVSSEETPANGEPLQSQTPEAEEFPEDPAKRETPEEQTPNHEEDQKMKTGDIVRISNAYAKSHNGLYFVAHSPGDPGWLGKDHCLLRITKAGKLSTRSDSTHFWPLKNFHSSREYCAKADAWNAEHAQITPATVKDLSQIAAHFQQEADAAKKNADWLTWNCGEDHPEIQKSLTLQAFYESVVNRLCPEGIKIPNPPEEASAENDEETARQIAEQEAAEKQRAEMQAKVEQQIQEGRAYIEEISRQNPIRSGEPVVKICWSEHPAFYSWDDNTLDLSPAAAEIILGRYDLERAEEEKGGYDKTKFLITWTDESGEEHSYEGRYDLGDNDGGLVAHIRSFAAHHRAHPYGCTAEEADKEAAEIEALADRLASCLSTAAGDVVSVSLAPWMEALVDHRRQEVQDIKDMLDLLTDEQLEQLVLEVDPKDQNVAKFFLQELYRRDSKKALDIFRRWKDAGPS